LAEPPGPWTADNALAESASRPSAGSDEILSVQADHVLGDYERWLGRQALAARTCSSYRRWVRELVAHLAGGGELEAFLAVDGEDDRRAVLGDWRRRLVDRGLAPSTVNLALAAATSLLDSRALPTLRVPRVEVDPPPARALARDQLRSVERETDRLASSRDRAIVGVCCAPGCGSASSLIWTWAMCV
jgi:hypothetical protein